MTHSEGPNQNALVARYSLLQPQLAKPLPIAEKASLMVELASVKQQLPPDVVRKLEAEQKSRQL